MQQSTQGPPRTHAPQPATQGQPQTHATLPTPKGRPLTFAPAVQATQTPIPQHFDIGIDDVMNDAQAETDEVFEEANR